MIWKPKEKQLSPEEAIALAKKELKPYWFGTSPLLAAIKTGQGVMAYPLDKDFNEHSWLLFFACPTDATGENALTYGCELYHRYNSNNVNAILVIKPEFQFLLNTSTVEQFIKMHQLPFPLVTDHDGLLAEAFSVKSLPTIVLLNKGQNILKHSGKSWHEGFEAKLQTFLRNTDPGLALLSPYQPEKDFTSESSRLDFGQGRGAHFPAPGFSATEPRSASFTKERPKDLSGDMFHISGHWFQDQDRMMTSDPTAEISFYCKTPGLAVVAQSMAKTLESTKLVTEVCDAPAYEFFSGKDLSFDEEGQSVVRVEGPRLYHCLANLPADKRLVTLRFPLADRVPMALYGLRFTG